MMVSMLEAKSVRTWEDGRCDECDGLIPAGQWACRYWNGEGKTLCSSSCLRAAIERDEAGAREDLIRQAEELIRRAEEEEFEAKRCRETAQRLRDKADRLGRWGHGDVSPAEGGP